MLPITSVEPITSFRVLILIDTSGSMTEADLNQRRAVAFLRKTLDELLQQLPQGVTIEYGVFNNYAVFGPEFTADPQKLQASLADLTERAKHRGLKLTALYDAVKDSVARFDIPRPGDSILILTDGVDNKSSSKAEKVEEEATKKGMRVFSMWLKQLLPEQVASFDLPDFAEPGAVGK